MKKVSSKLAAGVRKVKGQENKAPAVQPARVVETRRAAIASKPIAAPMHPERVWPD